MDTCRGNGEIEGGGIMLGIIAALILIASSNFLSRADCQADLTMGCVLMVFSFILFVIAAFLGLHEVLPS